MIRAFGGVIGTQTAPSIWNGAPGIWSLRDVAYFSSLAQWPGSGSQFAAVAFTHGPNDIGGAPYLSVYRYIPGDQNNAAYGISTKYPSPADTVGFKNYGLAFSPDNAAIGAGAGNYNYYNFYRWSDSGFGTRYNTPTDTGNLVIMDIHWNSSSNTVALACSTSGTPDYVYANGISYTPSLYVYRWTAADGFGTKYVDPVGTIPYVPESSYLTRRNTASGATVNTYPSATRMRLQGVGAVCFTSDSSAILHTNGEISPQIYAYNFTPGSGFGAQISSPTTISVTFTRSAVSYYSHTAINNLQLSADDKHLIASTTHLNQIDGTGGGGTGGLYELVSVLAGGTTFNNGGSKIFGPLTGGTYQAYPPNEVYLSPNTVSTSRIGKNATMVTKGTNAATSNVSILCTLHSGTSYNNASSTLSINAGFKSVSLANTGAATGTIGLSNFESNYYATGIDVTPNGREAVFTRDVGTIYQTRTDLNRPIRIDFLTSNFSVPAGVASLPFGAHKVRFNNFQQNS